MDRFKMVESNRAKLVGVAMEVQVAVCPGIMTSTPRSPRSNSREATKAKVRDKWAMVSNRQDN